MRYNSRRFLSVVLLATYAGMSILGEGLHELMPEAGHQHHHGLYVVVFHESGHSTDAAYFAGNAANDSGPAVTANDGDVESHICEICQFLFQSISQPAEVAAPIDWQPVAVAANNLPQPIYAPTSLGPQAPRGPPLAA